MPKAKIEKIDAFDVAREALKNATIRQNVSEQLRSISYIVKSTKYYTRARVSGSLQSPDSNVMCVVADRLNAAMDRIADELMEESKVELRKAFAGIDSIVSHNAEVDNGDGE